jgi:hypothetical protein
MFTTEARTLHQEALAMGCELRESQVLLPVERSINFDEYLTQL